MVPARTLEAGDTIDRKAVERAFFDGHVEHREGAKLKIGGYAWLHPDHHLALRLQDRKSTRLNSSHVSISYAVFSLKKKNLGTFRHPRRFKIVFIDIQITLKKMIRDFIGIRVNRAKKSGIVNITSSVNSRERSGINTILHELNPLFTINVTMRDIKSKIFFNDTATTEIYTLSLHDALPI